MPLKEVNFTKTSVADDAGSMQPIPEQIEPDWVALPHLALMFRQGPMIAGEVLLRLFCEAVGTSDEERPVFCQNLLARFGSIAAFFSAGQRGLTGIIGLDAQFMVAVVLTYEAAVRVSRARMGEGDILSDPQTMLNYLKTRLARELVEQFRILFLDDRNRLLADEAQTRGTVNHTPVYPREVARRAMEIGAKSLILVHNHPSGDPTPSKADIVMTRDTQRATALIEVNIIDHIIIGNGSHVSFRESGLLEDL